MKYVGIGEFLGRLVFVGLDSTDVGRTSLHQSRYQVVRRGLNLVASSRWTSLIILVDLVREKRVDKLIAARSDKVQEILQQLVFVLVCHALYGVTDITGVVLDNKLTLSVLEVWILPEEVQSSHKGVVRSARISMRCCTSVIEGSKNTRWPLVFNQRAYHLVIKVFDRRPLDLLASIFVLFSLQGQLDEDLLEFLINIINAELFERVLLEDFETIDIQNSN